LWIIVEAMPSNVILMMLKNQELNKVSSKDSRIKFQDSRFKNQVSRIKNQDQDSELKIQESREDSIKISIKKFFKTLSSTWNFHKISYQRVLLSGNRLPKDSNRLPITSIVFQIDLQNCNRLPHNHVIDYQCF